jgi:hypothetical protein
MTLSTKFHDNHNLSLNSNTADSCGNSATSFACCCFIFLRKALEKLVEKFSSYAYAHVAIYGDSFVESSKATLAMMKRLGLDAVANDSLISAVLVVMSIVCGSVASSAGLLFIESKNPGETLSSLSLFLFFLFSFLSFKFLFFFLFRFSSFSYSRTFSLPLTLYLSSLLSPFFALLLGILGKPYPIVIFFMFIGMLMLAYRIAIIVGGASAL